MGEGEGDGEGCSPIHVASLSLEENGRDRGSTVGDRLGRERGSG